jgi:hypothetical protein
VNPDVHGAYVNLPLKGKGAFINTGISARQQHYHRYKFNQHFGKAYLVVRLPGVDFWQCRMNFQRSLASL